MYINKAPASYYFVVFQLFAGKSAQVALSIDKNINEPSKMSTHHVLLMKLSSRGIIENASMHMHIFNSIGVKM